MLGHKVWQTFSPCLDTYVTVRSEADSLRKHEIFDLSRIIEGVSAQSDEDLIRAVDKVAPSVVINCIGIVKQDKDAQDPVLAISVNALFPHLAARVCRARGIRLIQLSTDCVFSGSKGNHTEADFPDAADLYGRSKLLGEVVDDSSLTIRTSMIGRELTGCHGLLEWFLSQSGGTVRGFKRAIFSGFTTGALADIILNIVQHQPKLSGLWHVAAEPINKFDLLTLVKQTYGLQIVIEPDETFICDRSLDATRFRAATGFVPKSWREMITRMCADPTPYAQIRRANIA
jgi:dTDP-4-dehydrorhamnose reductase